MRYPRLLSAALLLPLALFLLPSFAIAASPVGVWNTGKANVRISDCGGKLCGQILSLHDPKNPDGTDKVDANNPDPANRKRTVVGLHILTGFVKDPDEANYWTGGRIYNPEDGKTYKCTLTVRKDGTLRVRGYVGIPALGKTQIWTRVK